MNCKYENVENVIAKNDFEVFRYDDNQELEGVVTVPKGCKGIVESMGWSSADNFRVSYDVLFIEGDNEVNVAIYEEDFDVLLEIV
jgi:hypothetical protein